MGFKLPDEGVIELLTEENPKREGSAAAERWGRVKTGMTVKEAHDLGFLRPETHTAVVRGWMKVTHETKDEAGKVTETTVYDQEYAAAHSDAPTDSAATDTPAETPAETPAPEAEPEPVAVG